MADLRAITSQLISKDLEIRQAKEEWENTFDAVQDLILIIDTNFNIKRSNKAFLNFFNTDESQVIGQKCYKFIHDDDEPLENCPLEITLDTLSPSTRTAHLKQHYFDVTCNPIIDETSGKILGIVHLMHDITEIKRLYNELYDSNINLEAHIQELTATEIQLRERNDEIETKTNFIDCLTSSLPVPVAYLNLSGSYIDCNDAFANFYGLPREKIINKNRSELFPEEAEYFNDLDRKLIVGEGASPQRIFHTMYDKNYIPHGVLLIRSLHWDGEGNPIGILVVSVGIPHNMDLGDVYKVVPIDGIKKNLNELESDHGT